MDLNFQVTSSKLFMNNIPQEQNTQRQLDKLAAQRQLYSDAKALQIISVVISVPLVISWSILVAIFPKMAVCLCWLVGD